MKRLFTTILTSILLATSAWANAFDGFYIGPTLSSIKEQHSLQILNEPTQQEDHHVNQPHMILGYGLTISKETPFYLGVEAFLPLYASPLEFFTQGENGKKISHELAKQFPAEGAFKLGFPIDERVLLYGKIGIIHQTLTYKNKDTGLKDSWTHTGPIWGAGISFLINCKWLLNGEFSTYSSPTQNRRFLNHEHHHKRIQIMLAYRF